MSTTIEPLFAALAHGDDEHRAWLREAITAHFAGQPIPPPRGSGNKERIIHDLEAERERLKRLGRCPLCHEQLSAIGYVSPKHDSDPEVVWECKCGQWLRTPAARKVEFLSAALTPQP